ncbi:unnamed protein product [Prorocentrum cordatum]|uniref:Uncharacterized protein n=1 Tax=Prorocentrum cordatum TaxID=2364126 RepID=A0ABN9XCE0_9DINO|nr:unnamed protein product [Polarella glacialis]|mmetsp:Transcript_99316/g.269968  ORF Transcript_99316/g.269968 Transcript_99316/m.269968 type:complete len:242 (+) Transcript_99316:121-846(+)
MDKQQDNGESEAGQACLGEKAGTDSASVGGGDVVDSRSHPPGETGPAADASSAPPSVADANSSIAAAGLGNWKSIKQAGTDSYMADDFEKAIVLYSAAIKALEDEVGDEPEAPDDRKQLSILYTNCAMARLQIVKRERKAGTPGQEKADVIRKLGMRANVEASNAVELDDSNAKAWLRKGQALMVMTSLQQRSKQAMMALERARDSPNLPKSMKPEVAQCLKMATQAFNDQTDMPAGCPQM